MPTSAPNTRLTASSTTCDERQLLLSVRRSVSLLVSDNGNGSGEIVKGTYQSPILMQWRKPEGARRRLVADLVTFS